MFSAILRLLGLSRVRPAGPPDTADPRKRFGRLGEDAAAKLLRKNGHKILRRNFTCRRGEIDIIALDGDVICFVEVKTRRPDALFAPNRTVTSAKRRQVRRVAQYYLRTNHLLDRTCRFDIVSVVQPDHGEPQIEWIRHAF